LGSSSGLGLTTTRQRSMKTATGDGAGRSGSSGSLAVRLRGGGSSPLVAVRRPAHAHLPRAIRRRACSVPTGWRPRIPWRPRLPKLQGAWSSSRLRRCMRGGGTGHGAGRPPLSRRRRRPVAAPGRRWGPRRVRGDSPRRERTARIITRGRLEGQGGGA
jgi:hypothetical protein